MKGLAKIELVRNRWGRLVMIDEGGTHYEDVSVIPLFPITEPQKWISIVAVDGKEIASIENPEEYSAEIQEHLKIELTHRDFVPRISKVLHVSGTSEPCEWHVQTNHGPTRFVLKSEEDIRRLSDHEVMIVDANGGRYRVDDTRKLDARSLGYIEWYV